MHIRSYILYFLHTYVLYIRMYNAYIEATYYIGYFITMYVCSYRSFYLEINSYNHAVVNKLSMYFYISLRSNNIIMDRYYGWYIPTVYNYRDYIPCHSYKAWDIENIDMQLRIFHALLPHDITVINTHPHLRVVHTHVIKMIS